MYGNVFSTFARGVQKKLYPQNAAAARQSAGNEVNLPMQHAPPTAAIQTPNLEVNLVSACSSR